MAAFSLADAADLAGDIVRPAIFLLIKADAWPLRLWTGFGDFTLPADTVDTEGGDYTGLGELVGAPAVSQLLNGVAQRINFTLSGVDPEIVAIVDENAEALRDAEVFLGFTNLGPSGAPRFDPIWIWEGLADVPQISRPDPSSRNVSLSVGTFHTKRKRAAFTFYTGPDQRRRSPTDAGCDRVGLYTERTTVRWPT